MLKNILKNSSYLLMANALIKVIAFVYTLFLARNLGVENFGLYIVALSYFSLVSSVSDLGVNQYLIRESSQDRGKLNLLISNVALFRLVATSIGFALLALILNFADSDSLRVSLVLLGALACLPQSLALTFDSGFVAEQKLSFSALGLLALSLSTTLSGLVLIKLGYGVFGAVFALITGELIYAGINFINLRRFGVKFLPQVKFHQLKDILIGALPYGFLGVLGLLYFKVDSVILSYMKGSYAVGIYGAAYKFLEAIVFVPSALSAALFPVLSKMSLSSPREIYRLYVRSSLVLLGVSIAVVLAYFLILPEIIKLFLPQYLPSIEVIKIITLTIPFMFLISPQAAVLFAHKQYLNHLIVISIFNLLLNMALNFIFIPQFSYIASSWITVLSDIVSFTIFFVLIRLKFSPRDD